MTSRANDDPPQGVRRGRLLVVCLLAALLAGAGQSPAASARLLDQTIAADRLPNIVFVLADDVAWDLVRHMPQVRRMQRDGMTFRQFVVSDSLCCASRATILTGQFPHNTRVLTNTAPEGGYWAFAEHGARKRSVGIALQNAGYRTALMGKYLNQYDPFLHPVDPGWDEWLASTSGYRGFRYWMSDDGWPAFFGRRPRSYVTDVLARRSVRFIRRSAGRRPFFVTISSFAAHRPYTSAPRHRRRFRDLKLARGPSFDAQTVNPPRWLGQRPPLTAQQWAGLRWHHQARARSVQALDELIGRVRAALRREGVADDTYIVFGSDNGYHLGQHRLTFGKRTAFDDDVRVPLIVVGPGVRAGAETSTLAGTVDLSPTFRRWAGAPAGPNTNGRSLDSLVAREPLPPWRRALLVEHSHPGVEAGDPDVQGWAMGIPSTYQALRGVHTTYVEYDNGDRELYDRRTDPGELHNRYAELSPADRAALSTALERYRRCSGPDDCWAAGLAPDLPPWF